MLDYQPIICNTIFVCLASDVLEYIDSFNGETEAEDIEPLTSDTMIQIYYQYFKEQKKPQIFLRSHT